MTTVNSTPTTSSTSQASYVTPGVDDSTAASRLFDDLNSSVALQGGLYETAKQSAIHGSILNNFNPLPTLEQMRLQISDSDWNSVANVPSARLGALLHTPLGKELGKKLGEKLKSQLGGDQSPTSFDLTAAGAFSLLEKGSSSEASANPTSPTHFAGIQLKPFASSTPQEVFDNLASNLVRKGLVSQALAPAAAYLVLWKTMPEYLIRDMPANFDFNSAEGMKFTAQVRKMEADAPVSGIQRTYQEIEDLMYPERAEARRAQTVI